MIDEIQGPPAWEGPDVLLRQTSFRALAEDRVFRYPDGSVRTGALRVRFGEVEQRGIALTPRGRALYDRMVAEADARGGGPDGAREVWRRHLPATERGLAEQGLAFFTYRVRRASPARAGRSARDAEVASDKAGRRAARAGRRRGPRARADRLRRLPAAVRRRHLPVQPRRRGHPRGGPRRPRVRPRAAGRGARRDRARPHGSLRRAAGRLAARRRADAQRADHPDEHPFRRPPRRPDDRDARPDPDRRAAGARRRPPCAAAVPTPTRCRAPAGSRSSAP